jgi:hypothetical protein
LQNPKNDRDYCFKTLAKRMPSVILQHPAQETVKTFYMVKTWAMIPFFKNVRNFLFPVIEEALESSLTEKEQLFFDTLALCDVGRFMVPLHWGGNGRKPHSRQRIFNFLVLKATLNFVTTKQALATVKASSRYRMMCGWERPSDVPDETVVSRANKQFAEMGLNDHVHEAIIKAHAATAKTEVIARDSVPVPVREKAVVKVLEAKPEVAPKKRGRPCKGEMRAPPLPSNLEIQAGRTLDENLDAIPTDCDWAGKRNGQGVTEQWKGLKMHADVSSDGVPLACLFSSASVHDSQCDIPLTQLGMKRFKTCVLLKDAAYDAEAIRTFTGSVGMIEITDSNPRRGEKRLFTEAEQEVYKGRTGAERLFSHLDSHGLNNVRVRGYAKTKLHVMFGVLIVTAYHLVQRASELLC